MPGENLVHYAALRLRVNGVGNLKLSMSSLDDINELSLAPLAMNVNDATEPVVLANFITQRMAITGITTEIGERMRINRIAVFAKTIYTQLPQ